MVFNTGLPSGDYTVTVTDNNGCSFTTATATIDEPTAISFSSITSTDLNCFQAANGTISATGAGGTGTLSYDLEDDANNPIANPSGDGDGNYTGLAADTYRVRVTDANGCTTLSGDIVISEPTQNHRFHHPYELQWRKR